MSNIGVALSPEVKPTLIDGTISELYNYNNEQSSLLNSIESRLNQIIDRQQPVNELKAEPNADFRDAEQRLQHEIRRLSKNTAWLNAILSHVSEII